MLDDIKKTLWATADKLRANMDAAEYKHLVLGLIFVKYISDTFQARRTELTARFSDPADEYFLEGATPADTATELEDRDYFREANVFWVPEAARWEAIRAAARQPDIGKRIDDALSLIEAQNPKLKGILDKRFARAQAQNQLPDGKLGELVDLISTIGFGESAATARDLLGHVYEYFLGMFASAEGKRGGQFYTPRSIVRTLVAVLAPHFGKVYDPCCGSGGMFVQSEEFILSQGGKLGDVAIFGQEANPTTWRLAATNLAIRGIDFNLGREPRRHLHKEPVPRPARRLHPGQPAVQNQRLVARESFRRCTLGAWRPAAGQRQLRLAAARLARGLELEHQQLHHPRLSSAASRTTIQGTQSAVHQMPATNAQPVATESFTQIDGRSAPGEASRYRRRAPCRQPGRQQRSQVRTNHQRARYMAELIHRRRLWKTKESVELEAGEGVFVQPPLVAGTHRPHLHCSACTARCLPAMPATTAARSPGAGNWAPVWPTWAAARAMVRGPFRRAR